MGGENLNRVRSHSLSPKGSINERTIKSLRVHRRNTSYDRRNPDSIINENPQDFVKGFISSKILQLQDGEQKSSSKSRSRSSLCSDEDLQNMVSLFHTEKHLSISSPKHNKQSTSNSSNLTVDYNQSHNKYS